MRRLFVFAIIMACRWFSQLFYRQEEQWVGDVPEEKWPQYRLVALLNHTSLYEALFAAHPPIRFIWRMSGHGVVPVAAKTLDRPFIGKFWRLIAGNVVSVSRERDASWERMIDAVDDEAMVIILPEGRMKRANGLDARGRPLRIRSGIAEIISKMPQGRLLLAYSLGLHHIQIPDTSPWPKLFKSVRLRFESLDLAAYREGLLEDGETPHSEAFRQRVVADLTARRDRYCTSDHGRW